MWHYIYHNVFEATSRWEQAKFDMLGVAILFSMVGLAAICVWVVGKAGGNGPT